jgi:signal recognition particle subunit SRP54
LTILAERVGVPMVAGDPGGDPVAAARRRWPGPGRWEAAVLIVDTAGRLQIDEPLMDELRRIRRRRVSPREILFVADAMTGQEAVRIAEGFDEALDLTGIVLTKMDGDARGGAALSIRRVVGKPIKFVGVGRGWTTWNRRIRSGSRAGSSRRATWSGWWNGPSGRWIRDGRPSSRRR